MKNNKIKLGDEVIDVISGYKGIAVARTEFLNGCIQYIIQSKLKAGGLLPVEGPPSIDEVSLKVIKKNAVKSREYEDEDDRDEDDEEESNGGPMTRQKMRGY